MIYQSEHTDEEWQQIVDERNAAIDEEENRWKQNGFHPGMIAFDNYVLQFKVNMLVTFVEEALGVSEKELEARFKLEVLEQLRRDRGMLIEERRKTAQPGILRPSKKLLGPDGKIIV